MQQKIIFVSGPPASGKSTLARPLAEALGFALLAKDDMKESLYTSLVPGDGHEAGGRAGEDAVAFSRRIGAAAMDLIWALAPRCPRVMLEANFRTKSAYERGRVAALLAQPGTRAIEIHCRVPLEEAKRRFSERARTVRHHPAHALQEISLAQLSEYGQPFALTPVIEVDTTRAVDLPLLVRQVVAALEPGATAATARGV